MRWLAVLLVLLFSAPVFAQNGQIAGYGGYGFCVPGFCNAGTAAGPTYIGPGDAVSGAVGWYGLRAYNGAYAASEGAIVNVCNPGDGGCADLLSSSAGNLVVTNVGGETCSVPITSGTYVSATGAIVLVTVSGSNLSSTNPFSLSGLTGTGSVASLNGNYVATTGTTGTTVNATGTTGLGTVVITGGTVSVCTIKTLYDQSGSLLCGVGGGITCDVTQATIANRPILVLSCIGTLPCMGFNNASSQTFQSVGGHSIPASAQPYTISYVAERTGNTSALNTVVTLATNTLAGFNSSANSLYIYAGNLPSASGFNDNVFHAVQNVFNGASSNIYADGTTNTVNAGTGSVDPIAVDIGGDASSRDVTGYICEAGFWYSGFSGTNLSAMNLNQHTYWGF